MAVSADGVACHRKINSTGRYIAGLFITSNIRFVCIDNEFIGFEYDSSIVDGFSDMKKDAIDMNKGNIAVIKKMLESGNTCSSDPLKYADKIPPNAAADQHIL